MSGPFPTVLQKSLGAKARSLIATDFHIILAVIMHAAEVVVIATIIVPNCQEKPRR